MKNKEELVHSILLEIDLNKSYLEKNEIDSIYFGGGTPSILDSADIGLIVSKIEKYFDFNKDIEITLEANPDDINHNYLDELKSIGINRFSMGVQSFLDEELKILNRYHNADKAEDSLKMIQDAGFGKMNIDLIFGIPNSSMESWEYNLNKFINLDIPHLSCYNLTIEPKTIIAHQIKTGKISAPSEKDGAEMFMKTHDFLSEYGYEHYEISNYAKDKSYALHNTNYWKGVPYLGLGPSAHSYNGSSRQWNIASIRKYIESINTGELPIEIEILTSSDRYNEYIMTGLRTMWGVDIKKIELFGKKISHHFLEGISKFVDNGFVKIDSDTYILTKEGNLYADKIASDLFICNYSDGLKLG